MKGEMYLVMTSVTLEKHNGKSGNWTESKGDWCQNSHKLQTVISPWHSKVVAQVLLPGVPNSTMAICCILVDTEYPLLRQGLVNNKSTH